jgi:3-dehydroquinate dehydratase/shikimate dehydrogenase
MRVCASLGDASDLESVGRDDMVEIRLDLLGSVPDTAGRETLVTYRGPIDLSILPPGFSGLIDIGEEDRPETKVRVVASHHDYESTPDAERLRSILGSMDADVCKAATQVRDFRDLMSIHDAAKSFPRKHVVLGMGSMGTVTRIRQKILGNEFSFGYIGEPTAPGQLSVEEMRRLGDDCTILGIIGNPLGKSKSPRMQNAALREEGINGIYLPFETPDLEQAEDAIRAYDIRGVNVTVPYKQDIMDHLDRVDKDASSIGAVNTIVNEKGTLTGYNTDVIGIRKALERCGFEPEDRRVLVMGSGGAARACVHVMDGYGCDVTITGRNHETGEELAKETGSVFRDPRSVSVMMYDLIVNCTPVGMYSQGPYPINISSITRGQTVFDMVYAKDTALAAEAAAKGCRFADGADMLAAQGAASFELWTGRDSMFDIMRRELE